MKLSLQKFMEEYVGVKTKQGVCPLSLNEAQKNWVRKMEGKERVKL